MAPAQTNPRHREGDPRRLGLPHYDDHYAPTLASLAWTQFLCRKWELTCLPPWVAKEEMGILLLASEMPIPIPRNRTVALFMIPLVDVI